MPSDTVTNARPSTGAVDTLARIGYGAKAVVYLVIGYIVMQGVASTSAKDALGRIATQPFGKTLLSIVGAGLLAYAVWRFAMGVVDHEDEGRDATGIGKRIGYLASGLIYTSLALFALEVVMGVRSASGGGDGASHWTARLLSMRFGQWLVAIVGVGVIVGGLNQMKEAVTADFREEFARERMSNMEWRWASIAGRIGHAARFVIYTIIGGFLILAAWHSDASDAAGFGEALFTLEQQPFGTPLLLAMGFGFFCYAIMCAVMARYRK